MERRRYRGSMPNLTASSDSEDASDLESSLSDDVLQSVDRILQDYKGSLIILCKSCWTTSHRLTTRDDVNATRCLERHIWTGLLVHISDDRQLTVINKRRFVHDGAYYKMCYFGQNCRDMENCKFAHSPIERDIWYLQQETGLSWEEIVEEARTLNTSDGILRSATASFSCTVPCPHDVVEACKQCYQKSARICLKSANGDCCSLRPVGHKWSRGAGVYVILPDKKQLRRLPPSLKEKHVRRVKMCYRITDGKKCWPGCSYAHSAEERDIWNWMLRLEMTQLNEIHAICLEVQQQKLLQLASPKSSEASSKGLNEIFSSYHCRFCNRYFQSETDLDRHCQDIEHKSNVSSDSDKQWNHRPPPGHLSCDQFKLCDKNLQGRCNFSDYCSEAHSQNELDEWKQRYKWRQMKKEIAREQNLYSYMDLLVEDYRSSTYPLSVMTSEWPSGVEISYQPTESMTIRHKTTTHSWTFIVKSKSIVSLHKVALLYDEHRDFFLLDNASSKNGQFQQLVSGEQFITGSSSSAASYEVKVKFLGGQYGTFSQTVVFDFGTRPVTSRKLQVDVIGDPAVEKQLQQLRISLHCERWTPTNCNIVAFDSKTESSASGGQALNQRLLQKYKSPTVNEVDGIVTDQQRSGSDELNRNNYVHRMHRLLKLEELAEIKILSKLSIQTSVEISNRIQASEMSPLMFAQNNELFGRFSIGGQLNEDTDAGHLVLWTADSVLLSVKGSNDQSVNKTVYEARFLDYHDGFKRSTGLSKDFVCLRLSPRCCQDLGLKAGNPLPSVQIQSQQNRLLFCQMRYAVDQLAASVDLVFPDLPSVSQFRPKKIPSRLAVLHSLEKTLNEDQLRILEFVVTEDHRMRAPLVVYGAFGTGKTETLAQATLHLITRQNSTARVLICTHTNNAADEYVVRHFDKYFTSRPTSQNDSGQVQPLLRVFDVERRPETVLPVVKKYCLLSPRGEKFVEPKKDDLSKRRIVVTTLVTSLMLSELGVKGQFTHIFVDEAAQVSECQVIMPLSLATDKTCVVLAGDHLQMGHKVYSDEARRQNFGQSLVERLHRHYDDTVQRKDTATPFTPGHFSLLDNPAASHIVRMRINYRNHPDILKFISSVFYNGKNTLISAAVDKQSANDGRSRQQTEPKPLNFYYVCGEQKQDPTSTSWHNLQEINEVVDRVDQLCQSWPAEWGEKQLKDILVTTSYADQVDKLRFALKRKRLGEVTVLRVHNLPGMEFKAVFISTVLSRHLVAEKRDDRDGEFGFLTEMKLLNTALTRAKFLIAVVGDPIALCHFGRCATIWKKYLETCQQFASIQPPNLTTDFIRVQAEQFMRSLPPRLAPATVASANVGRDKLSFRDWSLDFQLEADEIIRQLATDGTQTASSQSLQSAKIRISEEGNHAFVGRRDNFSRQSRSTRVSEAHSASVDIDLTHSRNFSPADSQDKIKKLNRLIDNKPDVYKRCTACIDCLSSMYAKPRDQPSSHIILGSRNNCGKAFHNDEVVVEILKNSQSPDITVSAALPSRHVHGDQMEKPGRPRTDSGKRFGRVVGILKRFMDPEYRLFVCQAERNKTSLMVPLNRGMPKIVNLEKADYPSIEGSVVVYKLTKSMSIEFDGYQKIDDISSTLFVVRYLKWEDNFRFPLGIVVDILPPGRTIAEAMVILKLEHFIPIQFREATMAEVHRNYPSFSREISDQLPVGRSDYRKKLTFTIDPPNATDLDDALSVEKIPGEKDVLLIGIHIADVSHFVKKGSSIDQEARTRGCSFYPASGDPTPMLPPELSSDICSLLPDKDRLTVSVLLKVDYYGRVLSQEIKRSIIRSHYRLTYDDVEAVLGGKPNGTVTGLLAGSIKVLFSIAEKWREDRIGLAEASYVSSEVSKFNSPSAHVLVEEMMIKANHETARQLLRYDKDLAIILHQSGPQSGEIENWRRCYYETARNCAAFNRVFHRDTKVCLCNHGGCKNLNKLNPEGSKTVDPPVKVLRSIWSQMEQALLQSDFTKIRQLVVTPDYHPSPSLAQLALQSIQNRSVYSTPPAEAGDADEDCAHYSLNLPVYTSFTSPIRRYVDIVVHRLLTSTLTVGKVHRVQYSVDDLSDLCTQFTDAASRAKSYETATNVAVLCDLLQSRPMSVLAFVKRVSGESDIELHVPAVHQFYRRPLAVRLGSLQTRDKPTFDTSTKCLELRWSKRIYDADPTKNPTTAPSRTLSEVDINPDEYVMDVDASRWRALLRAVVRDEHDTVTERIRTISAKKPSSTKLTEPTSEGVVLSTGKHYCDFKVTLREACAVRIQLGAELHRGLMRPRIQLINLASSAVMGTCLEHSEFPVESFIEVATESAAHVSTHLNVNAYRELWKPIVAMEAVHGAVITDQTINIKNVPITWTKRPRASTSGTAEMFTGIIKADSMFCQERLISCFRRPVSAKGQRDDNEDEIDVQHLDGEVDYEYDGDSSGYMCIRYDHVPINDPQMNPRFENVISLEESLTWVGHCVVVKVVLSTNKLFYNIHLRLNKSNFDLPNDLDKFQKQKAAIEWIPKGLPERRMEKALTMLGKAEDVVKCIATGITPKTLGVEYTAIARIYMMFDIKELKAPNAVQQEAIMKSLTEPFSLIQGPPGTGKTVTAVRLAYLFQRLNRNLPAKYEREKIRPQVMICGPSNKSVDVVAAYLQRICSASVRLVRVYSSTIEKEDYPDIGDIRDSRCRVRLADAERDSKLRPISLHHLVRCGDSNKAGLVREMDKKINTYQRTGRRTEDLAEENMIGYRKTIAELEADILKSAHIILCTCTTSGTPKLRSSTNVQQLIIDECGMCKEPESLIPMVSSGAKQVVLIGDHKQLQPVILEKRAANLGLARSMFERYSDIATMLTMQYRMHEAIMAFPSEQFYSGRLKVGDPATQSQPSALRIWPNGSEQPIAFVHVVGSEQSLVVATEEGSEQSKSNQQEIDAVERTVRSLVRRHGVAMQSIAVLSQYRAQCSQITDQLKQKFPDVTVSTVVAAQGSEWDYVILSTVRSLPPEEIDPNPSMKWCRKNLGFITNENQINVAITRSKKGLIIIGNKLLLKCDPMWKKLLDHYESRGKIVNPTYFV